MAAPPSHARLLALDVFRGATVAAMLLVNDPGSWGNIYAPLRHAEWHGWTPTDLIFPFFLFIVGITTHLSVSQRRARGMSEAEIVRGILRRGGAIVAIGLLISAFPYLPLDRITDMRIPGVLQRIGVVYIAAALITLRGSWRAHLVILGAILLGYWMLMTLVPVPGQPPGAAHLEPADATLAAWLDRLLLDGHLWAATRTWDPEGILSTVPAVGSAMLGILVGRVLGGSEPLRRRLTYTAQLGGVLLVSGLLWGLVFPINKNIWTSSYVLMSGGWAALLLSACIWLIDVRGFTRWSRPFAVFGLNPLIAFAGSMLMARTIYSLVHVQLHGQTVTLQAAIYQMAFASWLAPRNASLAFAMAFVLLWYGILRLLQRRNIVLRV